MADVHAAVAGRRRREISCAMRRWLSATRLWRAENAGPPPSHPPRRLRLLSSSVHLPAGSSRHHFLVPLDLAHDWRRGTVPTVFHRVDVTAAFPS